MPKTRDQTWSAAPTTLELEENYSCPRSHSFPRYFGCTLCELWHTDMSTLCSTFQWRGCVRIWWWEHAKTRRNTVPADLLWEKNNILIKKNKLKKTDYKRSEHNLCVVVSGVSIHKIPTHAIINIIILRALETITWIKATYIYTRSQKTKQMSSKCVLVCQLLLVCILNLFR